MMPWAPNVCQAEEGPAAPEDSAGSLDAGMEWLLATHSAVCSGTADVLCPPPDLEVDTWLTAPSPPMEFSSPTPMTVNFKWSQTHTSTHVSMLPSLRRMLC